MTRARRGRQVAVTLGIWLCFATTAIAASPWANLPMTMDLLMVDGANVPFQAGRPLISFDPQDRPRIDLAGTWKKWRLPVSHSFSLSRRDGAWFAAIADESGGATESVFDDSAWNDHVLPGVENVMPDTPDNPTGAEVYFDGVYYRRHVEVPAAWEGRVVRLVTLSADYVADVWVNGVWAGYHEGGYSPFAFDISPLLNYGGDNVIVYRVDAMCWYYRMDILPNLFESDWMHYVGIVQDLYLEAAPAIHVVRADALPQSTKGDVDVSVVIENRTNFTRPVSAELQVFRVDSAHPDYLIDPVVGHLIGDEVAVEGGEPWEVGVPAGGYRRLAYSLRVPNPALWTPAEPNLYLLRVIVREGDEVVDTFDTQFGIRTIAAENAKVLLNRRPVFFTGMARHKDWPDTGRTATMAKIAQDLQIIRDTNVWFLRSAHYPNHPYTYLLTDRLGFAVWEEIPAWWLNIVSIHVTMERGLAKQMWREMIWRERNRPSVLFWSLCNEPMWYLAFNLRPYVQDLHQDLDDNYPDGRLVTQSLAADGKPLTGTAQQDVDVAGWTMYFGVFYGQDVAAETRAFLLRQHEKYPRQPIIACEFGFWSNEDGSGEQQQVDIANQTLDAFLPLAAVDENGQTTEGFLTATTWWCQFNWYRVVTPHIQSMGIMKMDRVTAKPVHNVLRDRYAPYFASGGMGPAIPDDDADDDAVDDTTDDDSGDDDLTDDDAASPADDADGEQACGC